MEDYLQNMKTLRTQMNDVEDQAAKISAEEQTQSTAIQTMEADIESAKSQTNHLKEEVEQMVNTKGQICSQILDKQKKIVSLEVESSTLSQTLELIQQERVSLLAKLEEKRAYYTKVMQDASTKLQEQQDWINSYKLNTEDGDRQLVQGKIDEQTGNSVHHIPDNLGDDANKYQDLTRKIDYAKTKLAELSDNRSKLVSECNKKQQSIQELKCRLEEYPQELRAMDMMALEEEQKALLSDKAGEMEYLQTLKRQIEQLKGISHVIKCVCGEEYKVEMVTCC